MELNDFKKSVAEGSLPAGLPLYLQALWHDAAGNWKTAHDLVDQLTDPRSAHVHAYLHRKEPDIWNADYWYSRAGKTRPQFSLKEEWDTIVSTYLP